jgi:hypothetical protein
MKGEDFADGLYWLLDAINWKLGGGYDASSGIDYRNDVFESFNFWSHSECDCSYRDWEIDVDLQTMERMKQYRPQNEDGAFDSEWWRLYEMEYGNVTQGVEAEHDYGCSLEDVGFRHFESGLEVSWYKRVGRSTESNKSMKTLEWYKTLVECLESVRDDKR